MLLIKLLLTAERNLAVIAKNRNFQEQKSMLVQILFARLYQGLKNSLSIKFQ